MFYREKKRGEKGRKLNPELPVWQGKRNMQPSSRFIATNTKYTEAKISIIYLCIITKRKRAYNKFVHKLYPL